MTACGCHVASQRGEAWNGDRVRRYKTKSEEERKFRQESAKIERELSNSCVTCSLSRSNSITATQQGDSRKLGGLLSHLAQLSLLQKGFRANFWSTGTKRGQVAKKNISLGFHFIASETSKQKFCRGLEKSIGREYMLSILWLVMMFSSTWGRNDNKYLQMLVLSCCGAYQELQMLQYSRLSSTCFLNYF